MTTFGKDGTPVVRAAGANKVETVANGTGDGVATSMVQVKTPGNEGCLGGKAILSGMISQMSFPAAGSDRGLGEARVSTDGIEVSGWMMGEGTPGDKGQRTKKEREWGGYLDMYLSEVD